MFVGKIFIMDIVYTVVSATDTAFVPSDRTQGAYPEAVFRSGDS
jgi:hypothetical protein